MIVFIGHIAYHEYQQISTYTSGRLLQKLFSARNYSHMLNSALAVEVGAWNYNQIILFDIYI